MRQREEKMRRFFNVENPVWKFIARLADFFMLSVLWAICSLPVITMGSSTTALYYVMLKMAKDQEGKLASQFFFSFKQNLKQGILIFAGFFLAGGILVIDIAWALNQKNVAGMTMLVTAGVISILYLCMLSLVFVLLARLENTAFAIVKITGGVLIQNFLPVLSGVIVYVAFISVGVFVFWPVLLVTPALPAYLNCFIYNRILKRYNMDLD